MGAIGNKRSHPQPLQCIPTRKASSLHSSYCGLALLLLLGLTTAALLCQLSRVVINWKQPDPKNVLHRRLHTPQSSVKLRLEKLERMELSYINSTTWNPTEAHRMVQESVRLGTCGQSNQGRKYRSLICTIVRNDVHLREFIVRSLLQGFCHIVMYDNNRIGCGTDHSIKLLLEPFISEGVVSLVPFKQNNTKFLHNKQKDEAASDCVKRFGSQADWVTIMDSDEYFHITEQTATVASIGSGSSSSGPVSAQDRNITSSSSSSSKTSLGTLHSFLSAVEMSHLDACALKFPWRMMYGNHQVLNHGGLLLDTYTDVCYISSISKTLFKPGRAIPQGVHAAKCKYLHERIVSVDDPRFRQAFLQFEANLLHYYSRSIEEYIVKLEQSMPPYVRLMVESYDKQTHCSSLKRVQYDKQYTAVVHDIMQRLQAAQGGLPPGGIQLAPSPEWQPMGRSDYALYIFLKLRVQQQQEWDEGAYLLLNPRVSESIRRGKCVDGLHHFLMTGFSQGLMSCWVIESSGDKFCII